MHVAYTFAVLYLGGRGGGKKKQPNFGGRETSCHKRLNWARLARQIAHSMLSQRDFLCSFSQETRESSNPSVLYS